MAYDLNCNFAEPVYRKIQWPESRIETFQWYCINLQFCYREQWMELPESIAMPLDFHLSSKFKINVIWISFPQLVHSFLYNANECNVQFVAALLWNYAVKFKWIRYVSIIFIASYLCGLNGWHGFLCVNFKITVYEKTTTNDSFKLSLYVLRHSEKWKKNILLKSFFILTPKDGAKSQLGTIFVWISKLDYLYSFS